MSVLEAHRIRPVGRIGFIERDIPGSTVSNFVQVLRPDPEKVDASFLGWALFELQRTGIVERVQRNNPRRCETSIGGTISACCCLGPRLTSSAALLPLSGLVDDAIQKARAELDATRELKRSLMNSLFAVGMPGRHTDFQETKIGPIPQGWTAIRNNQARPSR